MEDGNNISVDGKGKVVLNTGVVVLQNLPHTHDMMTAWKECTGEQRYPGCGQWRDRWSHEQRAFSEYIRYDFNPQGNNIVVRPCLSLSLPFPFPLSLSLSLTATPPFQEIPCNDANGQPGLVGQFGIVDDCKGEFIRHYTINKPSAKTSTADAMMQAVAELLQQNYVENHASMLIDEAASRD